MTGMDIESGKGLSGVIPLLQVGSLQDTLTYYEQVLGFRLDYVWPSEGEPKWAGVSRDGVSFVLTIDLGTSSGQFIAEKGNGVVFYIVAEDIHGIRDEMEESGAIVVQEMVDYGGRHQFSVADLNGYVITFTEAFGDR